tara:strand:+ start:486 stop:635 length:150 start_codon:yes stop_codon:yes gene_type:complete
MGKKPIDHSQKQTSQIAAIKKDNSLNPDTLLKRQKRKAPAQHLRFNEFL